MAQKALNPFFLCFFLIAVIILPQAAAQAEGGGRIDDIKMEVVAAVFPSSSLETASLEEGGGGSPDGNNGTKLSIKPSQSPTAKSKTESPSSGDGAGTKSTNTPTSSSKTVSSNPEGNCNEWTYYESCSTDYNGVTVCSEEAIYTSCPGADYYDYPDPEDHPTDAGTFPPCPPLPNRKLLRAL